MMFLGDKGGEISGRSVFGASTVASLLKNQGISSHPFETLLGSGFHETRSSIMNFGDVVCASNTSDRGALYRSLELEETIDEDLDDSLHHQGKKRRLSTDQVQFLEKSFEVDNKLEPERKIQLASELSLQPRQVAVWFQNRRARWKTKQLEKDLGTLKSSYNSLKLDYDNLLKENQNLNAEVLSLTDKLLLKRIGGEGKPEIKKSNQSRNVNCLQASVSCKQEDLSSTNSVIVDNEIKDGNQSRNVNCLQASVSCKQEDLSSTNSVIVDNDSEAGAHTPLFELTDSLNASNAEKHKKVKQYTDMKLEDSTENYDLALEDQGLWLWPC